MLATTGEAPRLPQPVVGTATGTRASLQGLARRVAGRITGGCVIPTARALLLLAFQLISPKESGEETQIKPN